jgi:lysophospholipase L1-like esterase
MPFKQIRFHYILLSCSLIVLCGCETIPPNSLATHNSSRWEKDIAAFEAQDLTNRPPAGCIVFTGSSSVRLWKSLESDFPGMQTANRGFGGSQLADLVHYAPRIITAYEPRQVVIYSGGNDINAGKSPETVFADFVAVVGTIRKAVPSAKITFISSGPNPARWKQVASVRALNGLVSAYCERHGVDFINVAPLMLGADGLPDPNIYAADRLHMNANGYAIWRSAVLSHLVPPEGCCCAKSCF